jgi:hypothetical protein
MTYRALGLVSLLLAAGCGGGGGSNSAPPPTQPTMAPTAGPQALAKATLTLVFPVSATQSAAKRPRYISSNSANVDVLITSVNAAAPPSWATADQVTALTTTGGSPNCTVSGGLETCTVPISTPAGNVGYTMTVTDASKNPLSTVAFTQSITQGGNNAITATLQGIAQTVFLSTGPFTANGGSPVGSTATVLDASGAQIVDGSTYHPLFAQPYTLTVNDPSGQVTLTVGTQTNVTTASVDSPFRPIQVNYTGRAINPFTITDNTSAFAALDANMNSLPTGSGTGNFTTTVNDIVLTGTTIDTTTAPTDPNYQQQTVFFSQTSGTAGVSATESGWTTSPFNLKFDLVLDPTTCTGVATASPSGASTSFTITAAGSTGICKARFVEDTTQPGTPITGHPGAPQGTGPTKDGTFWISVSAANFTGNSKARR